MEYTHANPMKKLILPTSIALLLLPCLSLLLLAVTVKANTQYVVPCSFNPMCSCKMSQSSLMVKRDDYLREMDLQNRTSSELAADAGTQKESRLEDDMSTVMKSGSMEQAFDVSCVGVPFAFLPALPSGKLSHVDIVSSGLEVAELISPSRISSSITPRIQIESLRLMSNKICHIGDNLFRGMEDDLKSLDLSYNELDEIPVGPLHTLRALVWANFHSNQISSLEGLGQLWTHLSSSLDALFLGNNDIMALQRSKNNDQGWDGWGHSLALLRNLNWLNLDGNQLTDLPTDTLPRQLHTLSVAHNRIIRFPSKCVEQLRDLRWLDLRGNFISELPIDTIRTEPGYKLRLKKLDLGENLISSLQGGAMFNRSLHVRDLYLDYNRIPRIPDSAFRGTNVKGLYLAGNGLFSIDERAFHSLSSTLTLLDLDRNKLNTYPAALDHLKKLRFLYLANNRMSYLPHGTFASFGLQLEELNLASNRLEDFPATALRNCPKLIHLNLAYNMIENVTKDMFYGWAESLEILNLKGNQIKELPSRLFQHSVKIRELSLSFNPLKAISDDAFVDIADTLESLQLNMVFEEALFPVELLRSLRQLRWLSLESNGIVSLPTLTMDLDKLQYLSLEGNRIAALNSKFFRGAKLRSLQDVRLSHNRIHILPKHAFHNLEAVTNVALASNRIQVIQHSVFDHLPKLVTLSLANNQIDRLEAGAFLRLPSLLKIDLQSNKLQEFSWDALSNCTNVFMAASLNLSDNLITSLQSGGELETNRLYIKSIDLSHNMLAIFPNTDFLSVIAVGGLKRLLLGYNKIKALPDRMFSTSCQNLQVLDVQHNLIQDVGRYTLTGATSLQSVDFSGNLLEQLPMGFFANLRRLRIVNLSNNRIRSISNDIFDGTVIETLGIAHNYLTKFPSSLSSISSTLINLDVSHNQIDHLDAVMLSYTPNLVSLNLAHNKLTLLSDNVFSYLNGLVSLDLSYNAIRANFKELFHEIQHVKKLNLASTGVNNWPHLPLPSLIALNLSYNALDCRTINEIPANTVIRLGRIRSLDLSRNRFTVVPSFLWQYMPLLKHLDLSFNPIRSINRDSFAGLVRVQTLNLQSVGVPVLENVDSDSLHSLFSLTQIKMQTWPGSHLSQILGGLRGLRKLDIEVRGPVLSSQLNYIATVDAAPKLKDIEVSGSFLKTINPDVFANTGIHTLPECSISFKHTAVRYLPEGFINGLEGCTALTLDLRRNALQSIGLQSIKTNNSLSATSTKHLAGGLWLESNQLTCSCENAWIAKWVTRWNLETNSMGRLITRLPDEILCRDPVNLKFNNLFDQPVSIETCSNSAITTLCLSVREQFPFVFLALVSILYVL